MATLWQERLREPEPWRPIETMIASRAETVVRTVGACLQTTIAFDKPTLEGEFPLDGSRFASKIPPVVTAMPTKPLVATKLSSLKCACCRPKPLQAAPNPSFRLCWRKIWLIRSCLKNAEREELRALHTEAQALADSNGEPAKEERAPGTAVKHAQSVC